MRQPLLLNSLVWALLIIASAVILKGTDDFIAMLLVLLMGSVATDVILRARTDQTPTESS